VIDALLRPWQGVVAVETGHIAVHEAGAIEFGGHKVLTLPHRDGKITAAQVARCVDAWRQDDNRAHTVMPGMVYLSQPTEYGTLYSLAELEAISAVCRDADMRLYVDGARLAYALATPANDVTLNDLARLCDAFYIGGTKCGALLGEAVVFPDPAVAPHFFTLVKQHGALLAKGRIAGIQFDTLFTDGLYDAIGKNAIEAADRIRAALDEKGYVQPQRNTTNQIFIAFDRQRAEALSQRVEMGFWENLPDGRVVMRVATSWATRREDVDKLIELL
jgi:threonine aldolase